MAFSILPHLTPKSIAAFNARVIQRDGCWEWTGMTDKLGYGRLSVSKNVKLLAHRMSYAMHHGVEPGDLCVCHRCDNPNCINPDHLFLGTHLDNAKDRILKGRTADFKNENNPRAILTHEHIENIRLASAAWMANTELGKLFGVHHSTISAIRRGKVWHKIGTPVVVPEFSSNVSA